MLSRETLDALVHFWPVWLLMLVGARFVVRALRREGYAWGKYFWTVKDDGLPKGQLLSLDAEAGEWARF